MSRDDPTAAPDAYRESIAAMYANGATQHDIAQALGITQSRVSRIMRRQGLQRRPARFQPTHGMSGSPCHRSWQMMLARCTNPRFPGYANYGARGISVCDRWRSFENFYADMGSRPAGTSLDRFPNHEGDYEPGNCRWATHEEQQQNRADNVLTPNVVDDIRASKESSSAIARRLGISISAAWKAKTGRSWKNVGAAK